MNLKFAYQALLTQFVGKGKVISGMSINKTEALNCLRELIEAGKIETIIIRFCIF